MDRKSSTEYDAAAAVAEARSYLGVKWSHKGRSRYRIDCIGLIVAAVEAGGVPMNDRRDYGREPWRDGLEAAIQERLGEPVTGEWKSGDVALLRWESRPEAGHVGVIGSNEFGLTLIHCHSMSCVIEHNIDEHWRRLILGVFRP